MNLMIVLLSRCPHDVRFLSIVIQLCKPIYNSVIETLDNKRPIADKTLTER